MIDGINITNYEMLDHFSGSCADAIVLDESSILKSLSGITRKKITKTFKGVLFKMCCTATPAPNDFTEIGKPCRLPECVLNAGCPPANKIRLFHKL